MTRGVQRNRARHHHGRRIRAIRAGSGPTLPRELPAKGGTTAATVDGLPVKALLLDIGADASLVVN